jgi:F-type H+-transporting ATPase subunit gamma
MQTLESLRGTLKTVDDLRSVVKTMKALAAVSIRQYERALESLVQYSRVIEMGFQVGLRNGHIGRRREGDDDPRVGVVVMGADQGLCGPFNEQVASVALTLLRSLASGAGPPRLLVAGARVAGRLEEGGLVADRVLTMPGSIAGVTPAVQELLVIIQAWRVEHSLNDIRLCHNRPVSGMSHAASTSPLLPVDESWLEELRNRDWPTHQLPLCTADPDRMFSALFRHYLFVSLYRAMVESLVSENACRLISMDAAERHINEHYDELMASFRKVRQDTFTEELLDISSGYEAITKGR